ncbi:hypothetical protein AGR4B_Lc30134 [Agrobacterium tumefaciens str. CFBP 5621]|nr:hypothetical protein AGR4B_Lc30134 [Agrobacterium tumefaciens str. CFBP 5621]
MRCGGNGGVERQHLVFLQQDGKVEAGHGLEIMLHKGRRTGDQQFRVAGEITLGGVQHLPGLALVEKQAVNVETFINQCRLPGIDRHGPLCQSQHFQVSGKNDIGRGDVVQGFAQREAGFRYRRHTLQKLPVGGFPEHNGHDAFNLRQPVLPTPETGQRDPCPARKQGQHPPTNGGVRQIMREIKNMGHAGFRLVSCVRDAAA